MPSRHGSRTIRLRHRRINCHSAVFGDPAGSHGFGQSFLAAMFPPGTFVPVIDYTMPNPVESQYESTKVVAAYDGAADFPDRPNLVSALNALVGAGIVHTPVAFTSPANVPPRNIITTTNSRGGTTTTYLVPSQHLPLTLPFRYMGAPNELVDQIDEVLQPMVDAGFRGTIMCHPLRSAWTRLAAWTRWPSWSRCPAWTRSPPWTRPLAPTSMVS